MFGFQKEVVINSADVIKKIGDDAVRIDGMLYKKAYMGNVFKTMPVEGTPAAVELDLTNYITNKHFSILIELGLDKDYRGDFASALYYFRKPILVDLENVTAEEAAKAIKKTLPTDYKMVETSVSGNRVTVTASDKGYIKVLKVVINEYDAEGDVSNTVTWHPAAGTVSGITVTENVPEFGTYNYLIQNLRLPTYENLRFTSPAAVEMPAYNTNYIQYSFIYTVPRHIGGTSVVGEVNHSTTTHTFYVAESLEATMDGVLGTSADTNTTGYKVAPEVVVLTSHGTTDTNNDGDWLDEGEQAPTPVVGESYPMHSGSENTGSEDPGSEDPGSEE